MSKLRNGVGSSLAYSNSRAFVSQTFMVAVFYSNKKSFDLKHLRRLAVSRSNKIPGFVADVSWSG
jgi:hypothetical protein